MSDEPNPTPDVEDNPPAPEAGADPDDERVTLTRAELTALERDRDEARKAAAAAAKRQRDRERESAKASGKYEDLYKEADERAKALEARLRNAAVKDAVGDAAQRLRFRNPALAARLIDLSDVDVDLDGDTAALDTASVKLIERRLTEAAESDPYLLADPGGRMLPGAGAPAGGNGASGGNAAMNQAIRRAAGRA